MSDSFCFCCQNFSRRPKHHFFFFFIYILINSIRAIFKIKWLAGWSLSQVFLLNLVSGAGRKHKRREMDQNISDFDRAIPTLVKLLIFNIDHEVMHPVIMSRIGFGRLVFSKIFLGQRSSLKEIWPNLWKFWFQLFGRHTLQPILEDDTVICTHEFSGIHPMENAEVKSFMGNTLPSDNFSTRDFSPFPLKSAPLAGCGYCSDCCPSPPSPTSLVHLPTLSWKPWSQKRSPAQPSHPPPSA